MKGGWFREVPEIENTMAEYLSPGVYVEEYDSSPRAIEGVGTSTAGFIGMTVKGPALAHPFLSPTLLISSVSLAAISVSSLTASTAISPMRWSSSSPTAVPAAMLPVLFPRMPRSQL